MESTENNSNPNVNTSCRKSAVRTVTVVAPKAIRPNVNRRAGSLRFGMPVQFKFDPSSNINPNKERSTRNKSTLNNIPPSAGGFALINSHRTPTLEK
jgi:hypothetical protein